MGGPSGTLSKTNGSALFKRQMNDTTDFQSSFSFFNLDYPLAWYEKETSPVAFPCVQYQGLSQRAYLDTDEYKKTIVNFNFKKYRAYRTAKIDIAECTECSVGLATCFKTNGFQRDKLWEPQEVPNMPFHHQLKSNLNENQCLADSSEDKSGADYTLVPCSNRITFDTTVFNVENTTVIYSSFPEEPKYSIKAKNIKSGKCPTLAFQNGQLKLFASNCSDTALDSSQRWGMYQTIDIIPEASREYAPEMPFESALNISKVQPTLLGEGLILGPVQQQILNQDKKNETISDNHFEIESKKLDMKKAKKAKKAKETESKATSKSDARLENASASKQEKSNDPPLRDTLNKTKEKKGDKVNAVTESKATSKSDARLENASASKQEKSNDPPLRDTLTNGKKKKGIK